MELGLLKKSGSVYIFSAKFRDFLGEMTSDTGAVMLECSRGIINIPGSDIKGPRVTLEERNIIFSEPGEMQFQLIPGNDYGKCEILLSCKLGEAKTTIEISRSGLFVLSEVLESVIYAFLVAIVIRIFFFQTFWIPSGSMEPTLHEKDRIIANKLVYRIREPRRSEVVIFRVFQPGGRGQIGRLTYEEALEISSEDMFSIGEEGEGNKAENSSDKIAVVDYIKRVVGLPGDVVEIKDRTVYVNGQVFEESYETREPNYNNFGPVRVPPGEVLVLGDNRANSQDSHVIGTVPIRNIEGRAEVIFWPLNRISKIPQGERGY